MSYICVWRIITKCVSLEKLRSNDTLYLPKFSIASKSANLPNCQICHISVQCLCVSAKKNISLAMHFVLLYSCAYL